MAIEFNTGADADLNAAVKSRYEANPDTNAYTDAEKVLVGALPIATGDISAARVVLTSDESISVTTNTLVPWDAESFDVGGWWDAGAPTRLTVPVDFTGKVRITALLRSNAAVGTGTTDFVITIKKNGADYAAYTIDNQFWGPPPLDTGPIEVIAGDYFEVQIWSSTAFSLESDRCFFAVHEIERTIRSATVYEFGTSDDEYLVTGPNGTGYETIAAALTQIAIDHPSLSFDAPAKIRITTRALTIASTITLPQHVSIRAENTRIHFTAASGSVFTLSGYNRIYGLEFCGGNASNTDPVFDCGNNTDISIIHCHLYGNDTDNFMKFIKAEGGSFARINIEHCLINFRGVSGYAFRFNNTGTSTRFVDTWLDLVFTDAYANFTSAGGNIETLNCRDLRILRSTIRGIDASYTGLRLSGTADIITVGQCQFDSEGVSIQPGFDIYGESGTELIYGATTAKKVGFPVGMTATRREDDLSVVDVV